jgi:dihydrofolate synthase/folylpolyglutamate synthase
MNSLLSEPVPDLLRSTLPIADAAQAGAFLNSLIRADDHRPYQRRPGQVAIRRLLERIGNPQERLRVIHIAGSKGKGSTALLTEAVLTGAGRRVGTFTSPHLHCWNERFRLNGRAVDDARFAAALERLRPAVCALRAQYPDPPLGFFDVAAAAALLLFREAEVDCAVIEAGLGGRLDATRVVQPGVTCITQVELEHTDQLGRTVAAIAREKAGIIKPGVPLVVGPLPPSAAQVIAGQAASADAPLFRLGRELRLRVPARHDLVTELRIVGPGLRIAARLPMPGRHLAQDAALAVACAQQFGLAAGELTEAVPRAFAGVHLPGRSEILCRRPWVVVDVAHTRHSARALADVVKRLAARRRHLLIGLSQDKNPALIGAALQPLFDTITVTQTDGRRAWPSERLADRLRGLFPRQSIQAIPDALLAARTLHDGLAADDLLCVTGSVYLAGAVRPLLSRLCAVG